MKIIDNKKDYYDYLMGVYGIDEKIVYDRRGSITYETFFKNMKFYSDIFKNDTDDIVLKVGDIYYRFVRNKSTDYKWDLPSVIKDGYWRNYEEHQNPIKITDEDMLKKNNDWKNHLDKLIVLKINLPIDRKKYITERGIYYDKCIYQFIDNPILDGFDVVKKFITPEMIWNNLYDYIAHKYDKKIIDTRSDVQKLESAGFDKKTSFRNM